MKIKICGIKTLEDAQSAIAAGADMLGFNFYAESPRYISPEDCAAIVRTLGETQVSFVGVFVDAPIEQIRQIVVDCGLQRVQLSGDEAPEMLSDLGGMAFKAIRPKDVDDAIANLRKYLASSQSPAYLVDASVAGKFGGTGHVADWNLAASLAKRLPILLAGGLTASNVRAAVSQVRPWGVDVASGVESAPGVKDVEKIRRFVQAATHPLTIEPAHSQDLPAILALQRLVYQPEGEDLDGVDLPPLTQTLADLERELAHMFFLRALCDKKLIGTVRAELREGTCHLGMLCVHPDWQGQGIGSDLVARIETHFEGQRYEVFFSAQDDSALRLFEKLGYQEFRREPFSPQLTLVYMEKGKAV